MKKLHPMLQHNLLIAYRNLLRHKGSFFINLVGLSTGLACAFLIYLWVNDELTFDKFHKNDSRLYQVMERSSENGKIVVHDATQGLLGESMAKDLPEIESYASVMSLEKQGMYVSLRTPDKTIKTTGIFASPAYFKVFTYSLLEGSAEQVLKDKNSIVISENLAISLFGSVKNSVGKNIEWELLGLKKLSAITGVYATPPSNNSMKFDFALAYDMLLYEIAPNLQKWWNEGPTTYVVLKKDVNVSAFESKIKDFIKGYLGQTIFTLFVRPYSDAYLYGRYENGVQAGGRIEYVKIISIVAIFIIVIACINFMNLSTAKASRRLKEVGIKKAMGSSRGALIIQFLSEAVFMAFLSVVVAGIIVALMLPLFSEITGKSLKVNINPQLIAIALGGILVTGILSGSYPAFYLSSFNPVTVLKGKLKNSAGEFLARKGLVVFQFAISLVLIISVIIIYQQINYIQSKNLGYDKSNIIYFNKDGKINENPVAFLDQLKKIPGVINASAIQSSVVQDKGGASTYGISWPGKSDKDLIDFDVRAVDYDMIETLGIQFVQGRSFDKNFGSEDTKLIFNEAAIKAMGLEKPIGTPITMWEKEMTISGVVKDFHISSLHEPINPMVFIYRPQNTSLIMAKIKAGKEKETLSRLEIFYKEFNPGYVMEYGFLDEAYNALYVAEKRVSVLSGYFAGLAILISCLGLFGLAAFNAEVRSKEIGIRKVLGASVSNVIFLLSKDFMKLILVAIFIAFPLAWWAMDAWLSGFAYRIDIGSGAFVLAGVCIIIFALLTVSYQSLKTALMNPVHSLRTE